MEAMVVLDYSQRDFDTGLRKSRGLALVLICIWE
jgi:hypothetical protein